MLKSEFSRFDLLKGLLKTDLMFKPVYIGPIQAVSIEFAKTTIAAYESGLINKGSFRSFIRRQSFYSNAENLQHLTALRSEEYAKHCHDKYLPKLSAKAATSTSAKRKTTKAKGALKDAEGETFRRRSMRDAKGNKGVETTDAARATPEAHEREKEITEPEKSKKGRERAKVREEMGKAKTEIRK